MSKENGKKVIARNTMTGRLELVEVDKSVHDEYRRGKWAERRNDVKQRKLAICFSSILPEGVSEDVLRELEDKSANTADIADRHELGEAVREAITHLPPRQREVVELLFLKEMSVTEAAAEMGIPHQNISAYKKQALKRLGKLLEKENF